MKVILFSWPRVQKEIIFPDPNEWVPSKTKYLNSSKEVPEQPGIVLVLDMTQIQARRNEIDIGGGGGL